MKLERAKNTVRNTLFGTINRIIGIVMPFLVRTVFIKTLGAEYLGLNSLFASILMVLNLTELGFSSAIVFCMYKPIAEDDVGTIDALLFYYKKVYRCIGIIISTVGLALVPILPLLIHGEYPSNVNLYIVYLVYLGNTVLSYFMFAYLQALISAFQREDLISKVNMVVTFIMYSLQISVLILTHNYYAYIIVMPIFTVVNNLRTAIIARKAFPEYQPKGQLSEHNKLELKEKLNGLIVNKLCIVSRNAFDSIFISMFIGLVGTAIYNNYYYIMNAVIAITSVFVTSVVSGVGNSVTMDSIEKNYEDMKRMNFLYMWICGWFTACLFSLYQPFMKIWVGEEMMYPMKYVVLFCLYFYLLKMGDIRYIYELAKGLWWENRYRSCFEAAANLVLNYMLGRLFGAFGIVIATILTIFFFSVCWGTRNIFKYYFVNQNIIEYAIEQIKYFVTTVVVCVINYVICCKLGEGTIGFLLNVVLCAIVPNLLFFIAYHHTKEYSISIAWIRRKVKI